MTPKEIGRRLRELRADPTAPGARAEAQRLLGALTRAQQARDVTDMQGPANRRMTHRQERDQEARSDHGSGDTTLPRRVDEPIAARQEATKEVLWGNDVIPASWPPELRRRHITGRW